MKTKLSIFCDKVLEAGWLVAVVAVPLFFNIYTARTFEPDKITLLRSLVTIMILAWIISLVEQGTSESGDEPNFTLGQRLWKIVRLSFVAPTLLLIFAYVISTILSISPSVSLWGSYQRLQGTYTMLSYIVIFAMLSSHLRTRNQIDWLITIIIITSVPISLYGIVQRFGLDPLPWAGDVQARVASTMGNAIFVASYLIMVMPLTMSRLFDSMLAIVRNEKATWGYTLSASVYIFVLAIQTMTVIFSRSRGPMLGILIAGFIMGLMVLMTLRQLAKDKTSLSFKEIAQGLGFSVPVLAIGGICGVVLGLIGFVVSQVASVSPDYPLSLLGVVVGGLIGVVGVYAYLTLKQQGWRWLWLSWIGIVGVFGFFFVSLVTPNTPIYPYLEFIRQQPGLERLTTINTETNNARVRTLIWLASMNLSLPHDPMGIPDDDVAPQDSFNFLRPVVGYGPESMFNAFALIYPPGLAHVESRGSSADRSHNETMDSLVITGYIGFIAYYYIMVSVFVYGLVWTGWASTSAAKRRLTIMLIGMGLVGSVASYIVFNGPTFVPLGLPAGLLAGFLLYLFIQGIMAQPERENDQDILSSYHWLLIGLLGAIIGHFVEVHFVFSIVATYTYFWVYRGIMLGMHMMDKEGTLRQDTSAHLSATEETTAEPEPQTSGKPRRRRGKGGRGRGSSSSSATPRIFGQGWGRDWQSVVGAQGLAMSIILIIITFDFITPSFEFRFDDGDSMALLWMYVITWLMGVVLASSTLNIRQKEWSTPIAWPRAIALYSAASLTPFFIYYGIHGFQFGQQIQVTSLDDIVTAANILVNGLLVLYMFLLGLMLLFAAVFAWQQMRHRPLWRAENWWLYPPVAIALLLLIWFKNFNVVAADIYLKEGDRYRSARQWDQAVALHEKAISMDSDEDFFYLMLALDYQLKAQDGNLDPQVRQQSWLQGEQIALDARRINPYNPDNTGNMGRYYFTLGQVLGANYYQNALDFFEKATFLAPTNVIYHNLWAQTFYILQDYESAVERLDISAEIDPRYPPTWMLLGDTYAAMGEADKALDAHSKGFELKVVGSDGFAAFSDQFLEQRLGLHVSAGNAETLLANMKQVGLTFPHDTLIPKTIGHTYNLAGQPEQAIVYFEKSLAMGRVDDGLNNELANLYLSTENFTSAQFLYESLVENQPQNADFRNNLAYIYARQQLYPDAIQQHQVILQSNPQNYNSLQNLAVLYQESGQLQAAVDTARQAREFASEEQIPQWDQFIAVIEAQISSGQTDTGS